MYEFWMAQEFMGIYQILLFLRSIFTQNFWSILSSTLAWDGLSPLLRSLISLQSLFSDGLKVPSILPLMPAQTSYWLILQSLSLAAKGSSYAQRGCIADCGLCAHPDLRHTHYGLGHALVLQGAGDHELRLGGVWAQAAAAQGGSMGARDLGGKGAFRFHNKLMEVGWIGGWEDARGRIARELDQSRCQPEVMLKWKKDRQNALSNRIVIRISPISIISLMLINFSKHQTSEQNYLIQEALSQFLHKFYSQNKYYSMLSYDNPICPVTDNKATLFCFSENCNKPAFACTPECLLEKHPKHATAQWSAIEEDFRQAMELPLAKEEVLQLERCEKQIKIAIEELKTIYANHQKSILQLKKRLQLKDAAKKVFQAVRNKTTNTVKGSDMAYLVKSIKSQKLFKNKRAINDAMQNQNKVLNEFITVLNTVISKHKKLEIQLSKLDSLPNDDFKKIIPTVDTANCQGGIVKNGIITAKAEMAGPFSSYLPVFGSKPLEIGQSFEVKIISQNQGGIKIGVATLDLRNKSDKQTDANCVCIDAFYSGLKTGSIITIQRDESQIEWRCKGQLLKTLTIHSWLTKKPLFPVLWIQSLLKAEMISKVQFV